MTNIPRTEPERELERVFDRWLAEYEGLGELESAAGIGESVYAAAWELREDVMRAVRDSSEVQR